MASAEPWDTIAAPARAELEVTRSRFIADLLPVSDREEVDAAIDAARRSFHGARHHCSASVLGVDGRLTRSNDDGEPAGTAGAPILAVLTGERLTDVVAVVTRYFGGTLLGAGGLVRAYGGAVSAAVERAERVRQRWIRVVTVRVGHADAGQLEHRLRGWASDRTASVRPGRYGSHGVELDVVVAVEQADEVAALLAPLGVDHEVSVSEPAVRSLRP